MNFAPVEHLKFAILFVALLDMVLISQKRSHEWKCRRTNIARDS